MLFGFYLDCNEKYFSEELSRPYREFNKRKAIEKHRVTDISKDLKVSQKFIYSIANNKVTKPRGRPKSFDEKKLKEQCKRSIKKLNKSKKK